MLRLLRSFVAACARVAPQLFRDLAGLTGAGLIVYGVSLIYVPAAFLIAGVFLLTAAWLLSKGPQ